jgi:hypothetical protein
MDTNTFLTQNIWWILILALWGLGWKGWSLWIAAQKSQKVWFVVLLLVNTAGILDIFYIFYFSKQKPTVKQK